MGSVGNTEVDFDITRGALTPELQEEVIQFWLMEQALATRQQCEARVKEVLLVARYRAGGICGVCTSHERYVPALEGTFHCMRGFASSSVRRNQVAWGGMQRAVRFLEERHGSGLDPGVIGVFLVVESAVLKSVTQALWPVVPFVYIGKNEAGAHLRVYYFPGAHVLQGKKPE